MKYPVHYLIAGSQGIIHKRDGFDISFTVSVAYVTVYNNEQYDKYWAGRLEYLKNNEKAD